MSGSEYLEANGLNAAEFAQSVLSEGALSKSVRRGSDTTALPPPEPETGRYGGWSTFSPDDVDDWGPLNREGIRGGYRRSAMSYSILSDIEYETEGVFRADYDETKTELKVRELTLYGFLEALGVDGPAKSYNPEGNVTYTASVTRKGHDTVDVEHVSPDEREWTTKIDRDEAVDKLAVHLLAGNWDLSRENVRLGEDGTIHLFDYDRVEEPMTDRDAAVERANYAKDSMQELDAIRTQGPETDVDPLDITTDDIADRAVEIATAIKREGQQDRLIAAAQAYEDLARETSSDEVSMLEPPADLIKKNIENLSEY